MPLAERRIIVHNTNQDLFDFESGLLTLGKTFEQHIGGKHV